MNANDELPDVWAWKRTRCVGVGLSFWPTAWGLGIERHDDFFGGSIQIGFGPFVLTISYNASQGLFGDYDDEVLP